jgi:hypothetical protein
MKPLMGGMVDGAAGQCIRVAESQLHEGAHDGDVDLNRTLEAQYAGEHGQIGIQQYLFATNKKDELG